MPRTVNSVRERLKTRIPAIVPMHNDDGHFYHIPSLNETYPSVTGMLQVLKDVGLRDWKMKKSLEYIYSHWRDISESTIDSVIEKAELAPVQEFEDAGDIGTLIHAVRERYFAQWIASGSRPESPLSFIKEDEDDIRLKSAMRALDRFCTDFSYVPCASEVYVFSQRYKVAGSIDDVGYMGNRRELVVLDIKSSNQMKDTYWLQVMMYAMMLQRWTNLRPRHLLILKLSKTDGTYKLERIEPYVEMKRITQNFLTCVHGLAELTSLRKEANRKIICP